MSLPCGHNYTLKNYRYDLKTRIVDDFLKLHNDAKDSLNSGDLVAFLLKQSGQTHTFILRIFNKYLLSHPALSLFPLTPCFSVFSFFNKFKAILRSIE